MIDPTTELVDWHVDLFYDDHWNEITKDVLVNDTLRITRGRSDYESEIPPSQCSFVLDNTTGTYSPKNPYSPLYGKIGRNQPVRVRVGDPNPVWRLSAGNAVSTFDVTGEFAPQGAEMTVDVEIRPDSWRPLSRQFVIAKGTSTQLTLSWLVILDVDGTIRFVWYRPANDALYTFNGIQVPETVGSRAFRFVWYPAGTDQFSASVGHPTVLNYWAETIGEPWQFDYNSSSWWSDFTDAELNQSAAPVSLGALYDVEYGKRWDVAAFSGDMFRARVTTPGTTLTDVSATSSGAADTVGRSWMFTSRPDILADTSARFVGDVQAWPARWGQPDGADAHVPISAFGIRQRLGRTLAPLKSAFRRASLNYGPASRTLAYWPMEDAEDASHFASAIGSDPLLFGNIPGYHVRDIDLSASSDFAASDPLPQFHVTAATGRVPRSAPNGEYRLYALVKLPDDGVPKNADDTDGIVDVLTLHMTGTISEWTLQFRSNGFVRFKRVRASDGAIGYTQWTTSPSEWGDIEYTAYNGRAVLVGMWVRQDGSDARYQFFFAWSGSDIVVALDYLRTGTELGFPTDVSVGASGDLGGTVVGHVTLWNTDTNDSGTLRGTVLGAYHGNAPEPATERVARILDEENVPSRIGSSTIPSEPMGLQPTGSALDLINEATTADLAVFTDSRTSRSMTYRPRGSMVNQDPVVVDYQAGHVVAPFEPTDVDENLVNDVTVQRARGSSSRAVQETGPLSVQDPPEGVGRYDESVTVNVADDVQLPNQAGWRLHMGTVDEVRYPTLTVSLNGSPELVDRLLPVDIGDRIQVHNLPIWVPPNMADLIVQGYTEESDGLQWTLTFNCTPASAWSVGVADDPVYGRADTAGSHLLSAVTADEQILPVLTTDGPRWVQNDDGGQFPFDVTLGGEHVTVSRIMPLLSDQFIRDDAGLWDDPQRGLWDDTFIWSD